MIKLKNCGDFLMEFTIQGTQSASANNIGLQSSAIVPFNGRLSDILARLAVAGVTGAQNVDLIQNGTSLTGGSGLFSFATTVGGNAPPTYNTANLTSNPVLVSKGDVLTIQNLTVHSGTAANTLSVYINVERQRSCTFDQPMNTDTCGPDSDYI